MRAIFSNIKRTFCLLFLVVFLSAFFQAHHAKFSSEYTKENKQQKENGEKAAFHQLTIQAVLPALNFEVPVYFLFYKIRFVCLQAEARPLVFYEFSVSKFFRSLFTCIIAINAP